MENTAKLRVPDIFTIGNKSRRFFNSSKKMIIIHGENKLENIIFASKFTNSKEYVSYYNCSKKNNKKEPF